MRRSLFVLAACTPFLALACGVSTGDIGDRTEAAAEVAPEARFAGTYATVSRVVARASLPLVGDLRSVTSAFGIAKVTAANGAYVIEQRACATQVDGSGPSVIVSEATSRALPASTSSLRVVEDGESVTFEQAETILVGGAELADPSDPLPTRASDRRVIDVEGDGKPGMTARVRSLFMNGEMYLVQRMRMSSAGTVDANGVFRGRVRAEAEQNVIGASNPLLRIKIATEIDQDAPENEIRMIPVTGDFDCDALSAQRAELFGN